MKATDHFKTVIAVYLEQRTEYDELFALSYSKVDKNIDDCITYILNEVQKSGCNGFTDDEVFSMALHYYDEDNLEVGQPMNGRVVVNHIVELTEEEKQSARREAMKQVENETYSRIKQTKKPTKVTETIAQPSLFDF